MASMKFDPNPAGNIIIIKLMLCVCVWMTSCQSTDIPNSMVTVATVPSSFEGTTNAGLSYQSSTTEG